jgi:hypothetical protein
LKVNLFLGDIGEGLPYRVPVKAVQRTLLCTGSIGPDPDFSFSQAASVYKVSTFHFDELI